MTISTDLNPERFNRTREYILDEAFEVINLICLAQVRSLGIISPSSFEDYTFDFNVTYDQGAGEVTVFLKFTTISCFRGIDLHFVSFGPR